MGEADEDEDDEGANKEVAEDGVDEGPDKLDQMIRDEKEQLESEKEKEKLYCMLEDHKTLLFPGCDEDLKKLDTTLGLLQQKASHGVTDKGFEELLKLLKKVLPKDNKLPTTTYEAKQMVCPLGLEVQKIHACPNDCILYRGEEYENLEAFGIS